MARTQVITRARNGAKRTTDDVLIHECIAYAGHVVAGRIFYSIDPPDSIFAARFNDAAMAKSNKEMQGILARPPVTFNGLRAKTALILIILDDQWGGGIETSHEDFFRSIADDVKRLALMVERAGKAVTQ